MVVPRLACATQQNIEEVAEATVACLLRTVPAAVPGIAFLSVGQSNELACVRLNAMHRRFDTTQSRLPWTLSFSFGRALQQEALQTWAGLDADRAAAQQALLRWACYNGAALRGQYHEGMR